MRGMSTLLDLNRYLVVIDEAASRLASAADEAGYDAAVPTCPGWRIRDLVAHQAMVHRWAAARVRGTLGPAPEADGTAPRVPDDALPVWLAAGRADLCDALQEAADDVEAMVFLLDAPQPRLFWARRQAHETTIHSIDAVSSWLGRTPRAAEVGLDRALAVDGIDELLTGFVPRDPIREPLSEAPYTLQVAPDDVEHRWTMTIADHVLTTAREPADDAVATWSGTAAELYLGLWGRGSEITEHGVPGALAHWRAGQHVRWR